MADIKADFQKLSTIREPYASAILATTDAHAIAHIPSGTGVAAARAELITAIEGDETNGGAIVADYGDE